MDNQRSILNSPKYIYRLRKVKGTSMSPHRFMIKDMIGSGSRILHSETSDKFLEQFIQWVNYKFKIESWFPIIIDKDTMFVIIHSTEIPIPFLSNWTE